MNRPNLSVVSCAFALFAASANAGLPFTSNNETNTPEEADSALLVSPPSIEIVLGDSTELIFVRVSETGLTEPGGPSSQVIAEIGFGPQGSDPRFSFDWLWFTAEYSLQEGAADEYLASISPTAIGAYSYTYRFSFDGGMSWTLADLDGAGSDAGLDFDPGTLGTISVVTSAQVIEYAIFKSRFYTQSSAAGPIGPESFSAVQRLFGTSLTPSAVGNAQVTYPSLSTFPLTDFAADQFVARFAGLFATEAELDEAVPPGIYQFQIDSGELGFGTADLDQPADNRWSSPPTITNFDSLQSADAASDITVEFEGVTLDPAATNGAIFYNVFDTLANQQVFTGADAFTVTNFTMPAGTLLPARLHVVTIDFSARTIGGTSDGSLANAFGESSWDTITTFSFRTAPACAGDANDDGFVTFTDITTILANLGADYGPGSGPGDASGDGVVTFTDITTVLANLGVTCN